MEREGPFAFGEHGTSGKLKKKGRALGIRMDSLLFITP